MMDPKAKAAERLLRALGVAIKTHALYPLPHPMTDRAVQGLLAAMRPYTDAHGPFAVRVTKYALSIGGVPFKEGPYGSLALYLYVRKILSIKFMPTVSEDALAAFISAVGMDRGSLEEAGGVKLLLRQSGVGNIQVTELAMEQEETPEPFDLNAVFDLLSRGRLAPAERERIVETLRLGPDAAGKLLEHAYAVGDDIDEGFSEDEQAQQIYQMLKSLDRLVLDEPFEDQPQLYAAVAGAHVQLREPHRTLVTRLVVSRDEGDLAARLLGPHQSEDLARLLESSLARESTGERAAGQVAAFLRAVCADRQKARAVLSLLGTRFRASGQDPGWLTETVLPQIQPWPRREPGVPADALREAAAAAGRVESARGLEPATVIDEAAVIREVVQTLVDVLWHEHDEQELANVADALVSYLPWLATHQEYRLLAKMLTRVRMIALSEGGSRRQTAVGILRKATEGGLVEELLSALWESRETPVEDEIRSCLKVLADHLVSPLVRSLGTEPRGVMRAALCDLLVDVGGSNVDELGAFIGDARWFLVRNVVNVLGRLRSPRAVPYLERLVGHLDYRVRRETVIALAAIGTEDAQTLLTSFLDDPDERIRSMVLQSLDTSHAWLAMPRLLALLERRDPFNRLFSIRRAALEALARLGARQSLPAINRISRARLVFGWRGRELRRLARVTAAIIEGGRVAAQDRPLLPADER